MSLTQWVEALNAAIKASEASAVADLFHDGGMWRDYLGLGGTLQTLEGKDAIQAFAVACGADSGFNAALMASDDGADEGFITFQTTLGHGRGYVRLQGGKAVTLFTSLEGLNGYEEPTRQNRNLGLAPQDGTRNWKERTDTKADAFGDTDQPYTLIVGGGQAGLALGARLEMQGVPYLIIDKHPTVGDQWRSRYKSLTLHDPVWYDHMPYLPFPDFWPVYTPKDKMGDWLESYARALELAIWTDTECKLASRDEATGTWNVDVVRNGKDLRLTPTHLVMAVGNAGFPVKPEFEGQSVFKGKQMHSSAYQSGEGLEGKKVVIVGANNSAHDIAADLVEHGAHPTMIQRSSTLIIRQSTLTDILLKPVYSQEAVDSGISTEVADLLGASVPLRVQEQVNKQTWDQIREAEATFYSQLDAAGFQLDFGEDGTGLAMKYQRAASGYYIDVGACQMVIDGRIDIRSNAGISHLTETGVVLEEGEELEADVIIYATGFGSMEEWVARLINPETAQKIGKCWGYGSGYKGDPGPWEGELRNMWKPTAQDGLWFMGGNLAQSRYYSGLLGLQLKARHANIAIGG